MTALAWPAPLKPSDVLFALQNQSRSGGLALSGVEQVVTSFAARWRASIRVRVRSDAQILAARAFVSRLGGRVGTALVPAFDTRRASWPVDAWGRTLHPGFTRDRTLDGTAYEDPSIPDESAIDATVDSATALGALQISINVSQGEPPLAGQYFGVGNYLHLITEVVDSTGDVHTVNFVPRLRAAVSGGAAVTFTRPVSEMRLLTDDSGTLALRHLRFGDLDLEFVEAF